LYVLATPAQALDRFVDRFANLVCDGHRFCHLSVLVLFA